MNTILVVDDDVFIRWVMVQILKTEGHVVDESSNGAEAIDRLKSTEYDLVITDIVMPMGGGETIASFMSDNLLDTPVLAVSSCPDGGKSASLFDFANLFSEEILKKPFTKEQFLGAVERHLPAISTPSRQPVMNEEFETTV